MGPMLSKRVDDTGGGWSSSEGQRNGLPMFVSGMSSTLLILFFFSYYLYVCLYGFYKQMVGLEPTNESSRLRHVVLLPLSFFPSFFYSTNIIFYFLFFSNQGRGWGTYSKKRLPQLRLSCSYFPTI